MTRITHRKTGPTVISSHAYGYDDAGQRLWVKRANGKGDVYGYNPTHQLTNVLYENVSVPAMVESCGRRQTLGGDRTRKWMTRRCR